MSLWGRFNSRKLSSRHKINYSLQNGLILSFMLVCGAMVTIFLYYVFGVVHVASEQAEDSFQRITGASQERIEHILTSSQESAQLAAYSSVVQQYLLSEQPSIVLNAKSAVSDTMTYISVYGDGFTDIVLLSNRGRKISITNSYIDIIEEAVTVAGLEDEMVFRTPFFSPIIEYSGEKYVVFLFPVYGNIDGYRYQYNPIICGVIYKLSALLDSSFLSTYSDSLVFLCEEGIPVVSSRELSEEEQNFFAQIDVNSQELLWTFGNEQYYVNGMQIEHSNWELVYLTPKQSVMASLDQMRSLVIMITMVVILAIMVLILTILITVRRDIYNMTEDIRQSGTEHCMVRHPVIAELKPISAVINSTMIELRESMQREQKLIANSYEARLSQIQAEMLAYRSQINPHFLFNTLESVRALAHQYGASLVEQLVGDMSQMCRYSLYSPTMVKLEDELGNLGSYLSVMDVRFPGRYRVLEDIEPDTLSWPVLSMLLQPLAENILLHAFVGRRGGIMLVQTFIRDERLVIRLADNGIGMPEDVLDAIVRKMKNTEDETARLSSGPDYAADQKISIGLPNIYRRLKLTFGEHAHLVIRSKEGYYTVVELHIPRNSGREKETA